MGLKIRLIDYADRVVITADERRLPITDLFDRAGLPTRHVAAAVLGVAGGPGDWISFRIAPFDRAALQ